MNFTIRDAHSHFFSRVFFDTLARQAPGGRPPAEKLAELEKQAGIELPGEDPTALQERWLQQLDDAGVDTLVTFASVPEEAETVAEATATSGGRMAGYTVMNLAAPNAAAFADRALGELGLKGVVLFPAMHHYDVSEERCRAALERVRAHRGVCVVHCGVLKVKVRDLLGLPRAHDARYASPLNLVRAACEFPEVPFVVPHFGGGMLAEALLAGSWCENLYLDTSSSNDWMAATYPRPSLAGVFARALEVFGDKRILFGTDSSTFPRGYRRDLLDAQLQALDEIGAGEDAKAAILGGNLERLLGL